LRIARRIAIGTRAPPMRTRVDAGSGPCARAASSRLAPCSGESSSQVTACLAHSAVSASVAPSARTQVPPCQSVYRRMRLLLLNSTCAGRSTRSREKSMWASAWAARSRSAYATILGSPVVPDPVRYTSGREASRCHVPVARFRRVRGVPDRAQVDVASAGDRVVGSVAEHPGDTDARGEPRARRGGLARRERDHRAAQREQRQRGDDVVDLPADGQAGDGGRVESACTKRIGQTRDLVRERAVGERRARRHQRRRLGAVARVQGEPLGEGHDAATFRCHREDLAP
jgi:hypothetical protein